MVSLWTWVATRWRRLHAKWAAIPFEKKLGMFVAPVFVAVASWLAIQILSDDEPPVPAASSPTTAPSPPTATLPTPATRTLQLAGLAVRDASDDTTIDVTLANGTDTVAVATRARFRVAEFRTVSTCLPQAYLVPSHTYDLVLPAKDAKGKVIDVDISQAIQPNKADRFAFRVGVDVRQLPSTTSYLYSLKIQLFHDGRRRPMRARTVVVAKPFPGQWFSYSESDLDYPGVKRCMETNRANLKAVIARGGTASPELLALARDAGVASPNR